MIYEIKQFVDDDGKQLVGKFPVGEGEPQFIGMFIIPTPYGGDPQNFEFPEGYTLEQCFEDFQKFAEEEYDRLRDEAQQEAIEKLKEQQSTIVTPNDKRKGGIIIP